MVNIFFLKHSSVVRGNAHVERYIEHALARAAGVRLIPFDLVTEARRVKATGLTDDAEIYRRYGDDIVERVRVLRPDIFLVINGYALELQFTDFFARIRRLGVTTVAWHADDPYYVDLQEAIAPHLDYVFTVDSSTVDFWRTRVRHASWLPFGFAPESMDGIGASQPHDAFSSDVCFVGAPFEGSRRVRLIDAQADLLSGLNTRIMGATAVDTWAQPSTL